MSDWQVPPPLAIGTVELESGELCKGFVCEGYVGENKRIPMCGYEHKHL